MRSYTSYIEQLLSTFFVKMYELENIPPPPLVILGRKYEKGEEVEKKDERVKIKLNLYW